MDAEDMDALLEWAERLLRDGAGDDLVAQVVQSGEAAQLWADDTAWGALAERQGGVLGWSPLLDVVALREQYVASGRRLLLPPPGRGGPVGVRSADGSVSIDGLLLGELGPGQAVVTLDGGRQVVVAIEHLLVVPADGWDPDLPTAVVTGRATGLPGRHEESDAGVEAVTMTFLARMLLGVGEAALAIAIEHVMGRTQFGRPLAAFQVPAHRLAQCRVRLSGARALLDLPSEGDAAQRSFTARLAKASAGRAALEAVAAAQQVCGAMGFTVEFGLHRFVRRAYFLDSLYGGMPGSTARIGDQFCAVAPDPCSVPLS